MRAYGGLINRIYEEGKPAKPEVGMGATELLWSDRYPCTIVEVINEKTIVVQADNAKRTDNNGQSEMQIYEFSPNPEAKKVTVTLRKNGRWVRKGQGMRNGTTFAIGFRSRYDDPCF